MMKESKEPRDNIDVPRPFQQTRTYREGQALYCRECGHPVTPFVENGRVYMGCLSRNVKVSGERWADLEGSEDLPEPWAEVPFGFWPTVSELFVETIEKCVIDSDE